MLADDHRLWRETFARLLEPHRAIVGAVGVGRALLAAARELQPEVVVLDVGMPTFLKERSVLTLRKNVVNLYVDRVSQQWIVLDGEGNLWLVPGECENPWKQRQPFYPNEETALEPVPRHYK